MRLARDFILPANVFDKVEHLRYFLKPKMDAEPLYCAEQIKVPEGMPEILKEWTKAVIRAQPKDINAWSAECVHTQCLSHLRAVCSPVS